MTRTVALTGGTGFIGSTIQKFLLDAGHSVRSLYRNISTDNTPSHVTKIIGNLHDPDAAKQLIAKADTIIHCAGRVRGYSEKEFIADNVDTTRNLLNAAYAGGQVDNFVYISSLAAREPSLSDYAKSKHLAEEVIRTHPFNAWTIVRPPAVYGPGDRELRPLFDWMRRGILWVPGNAANRFSMLHCEDLANLITHMVRNPLTGKQIIEPDDGKKDGYQWVDIRIIGEKIFNRKVNSITLSPTIMESAARVNVIFSRLFGKSPMLTSGKVRELLHTDWVSNSFKPAAGWRPDIEFGDGLRKLYPKHH